MRSIIRTWIWLRDINAWYREFNGQRNLFYKKCGLIGADRARTRLPASTGIGIELCNGAACGIDVIACPGSEDTIEYVEAGGDQRSAYNYGSAFSRATIAPTPAGRTAFVSGTAAVDLQGRTEHINQVEGQIDSTLAHVRSILNETGCSEEHVLSAIAYCKTPEVEQVFLTKSAAQSWPCVIAIAEICRPDLLFEVEVTASLTAQTS